MRRSALRGKPYDWEEVDALLALGDACDGPDRLGSGMLEMQRCFDDWAERLGWGKRIYPKKEGAMEPGTDNGATKTLERPKRSD